ncbi:MAG: FtsQ-type POTRA domain-containing protein [Solirubrobacterales bacterium]
MTLARRGFKLATVMVLVLFGWIAYSWLRDSALVKVRHVEVNGITGPDAPAIRRALTASALDMTTLHVDGQRLKSSVSEFPIVRSISTSADFPAGLEVTVHEYRPAAVISGGGGRKVAVAEDGTLLPRVGRTKLPSIKVNTVANFKRLSDPHAIGLVALLSKAPKELRPLLERAYWGSSGIRVALRDGPTIVFGSPEFGLAKWRAATRVLADSSASGAASIDVRLPERPSAGGFAAGEAGTASAQPAGESDSEQAGVDPEADPAAPDATVPAAPVEPPVAPSDPQP